MGISGLVGALAFHEGWNVVRFLRYSLRALSHRGVGKYWVAVLRDGHIAAALVDDLDELSLESYVGIGCAPTEEGAYGVVKCGDAEVAYCTEGSVVEGSRICSVLGGDPLDSTSVIAVTSDGELVGYRASSGLRNMYIGAYGFDLVLLSNETPGISIVGGSVRRSLRPGEFIRSSRVVVRSIGGGGEARICSLELIYISRNDSHVDGVSTYSFRVDLAERMARKIRVNVDSVVGIPDTGLLYGVKLAQALGKPADLSLVMTERRRSALMSDQLDRLASIQLKASPVVDSIRGRRILLVDDSLISGLTIKALSQLLRHKAGAREVHVAIVSPRIVRRCPYGVNMPSDEYMLSNAFSDDELRRLLEVDSVTWLDIDDLIQVGDKYGISNRLCMDCFIRRNQTSVPQV